VSPSPTRVPRKAVDIGVGDATIAWFGAWLVGNLVGSAVVAAEGSGSASDAPVWVTLVSAVVLWVPFIAVLYGLSRRSGTGRLDRDFGLRFAPVDLIGVPIGVLAQLVLVRLIYLPLQHWWPGTFDDHKVEQNARDLYHRADGAWIVLLFLVVAVGAPLVEELVYRGLLQGAFVRRLNDTVAVVLVAAWFAVVHFRAIEYPGLFAFGLVLGVCALRTRRLGMGILAHVAFNVTGLALVAWV
jgi:membrane protease YdiL (CAAX protease family)